MPPGKYEDPPQETIPDSKEDRLALLALIDEWLKPDSMKSRRLSTFIDINLLKLPPDAQFPREWSDQSKAEPVKRHLEVKLWKKMVDPYIFLCGSLHLDTVHAVFPQLQTLYGMGANCSVVVDHIAKRSGEVTAKFITEVGTAIVIWALRDPRFVSEMPSFKTAQARLAWFKKILHEQPLLHLVLMYQCFWSSLDIPFVFSNCHYDGAVVQIQSNMRELICNHTLLLLNAIFLGMFNFDVAKGVGQIGYFRNWITLCIPGIFYQTQLENLKPERDQFPVAPRWPYQNRRVPWANVTGTPHDESGNDEGDKEGNYDETGKGRKRGRASDGISGGSKRQRH
ncbi:hypothetical protein V8E51_008686 [Hyaloscypha variabilis]